MKPSIIVSSQDIAGMNIKTCLQEIHGFRETTETFHSNKVCAKEGIRIYTTDKETIHAECIDREVEGDWIIFATRHKAASGKKSLSVHVTGNWSNAEAGGKDRTLCCAASSAMKEALKKIENAYAGDEFEIVQEATHHGPFTEKPCMFIEIGSSEEEWRQKDAGELIAKAIDQIAMNPIKKYISVAVLGGGHYNTAATKLMLKTEYAVGHICPKHFLAELDEELLMQAAKKSGNDFEMFVLDWKGLGSSKNNVLELLNKLGLKHERYQRIAKEE